MLVLVCVTARMTVLLPLLLLILVLGLPLVPQLGLALILQRQLLL